VDTGGLAFREVLEDVETLNIMAAAEELDITKVSLAAFAGLRDSYALLRSGGALGRGCGPLVVARESMGVESLKGKRIAIPGLNTTAFMLLRLLDPALGENVTAMPFNEIMPAVRDGIVDAGLIIHESRFTFPVFGLKEIEDLGRWWERETGLPIPLGCIIARRSMGAELAERVEGLVRKSIEYSFARPGEPVGYIKAHSQEMEGDVIKKHIDLYVNDYSLDLGDEGVSAVEALFSMAEDRALIKPGGKPLFMA
jgi:1,4-dihydroxy-6-naphthoate synthase